MFKYEIKISGTIVLDVCVQDFTKYKYTNEYTHHACT